MTSTLAARSITATFLECLFADLPGLIEFRALPSADRCFVALTDLDRGLRWIADHLDEHVFAGIATRRNAIGGTLANCHALGAAFVDLDFKTTAEADARPRLARFPLRPSLVVRSGGGLHPYFAFREPLDLTMPVNRTLAYTVLRRLARHLGGDLSAAEPARVLRVPGTLNHKYSPPRWVTLEGGP